MTLTLKKTILTTLIAGAATMGIAETALAKGKGGGPRIKFEELDANADGFVTAAELEAQAGARFATADADKDGFLTKEEMAAAKPEHKKRGNEEVDAERQQERMDRHFRGLDANDDGKIAQSEMPTRDFTRMIERLDTDKDGKISKAEMEAKKKGKRDKKED